MERAAIHKLHRYIDIVLVLANLVDLDDVGVRESGQDLGFGDQAVSPALMHRPAAQELERHGAAEACISCGIDDAHPTGPHAPNDLVVSDALRGHDLSEQALDEPSFHRHITAGRGRWGKIERWWGVVSCRHELLRSSTSHTNIVHVLPGSVHFNPCPVLGCPVLTDDALLDAWRAGDRHAGSQLFRRHFEAVRRFVVNKVDGDVEDIVQRTFMACVEGKARFEGRSSFRSYLLGIAYNMVRKHWADRVASRKIDDIEQCSVAYMGGGPSTLLGRDQQERLLLGALRQIPLSDQMVLELYYWERLSGRELGEHLGMTENSARSRLRRAKLTLAKELRRMENLTGVPESTEQDLERWAASLRAQLERSG